MSAREMLNGFKKAYNREVSERRDADSNLHVSNLIDFCSREYALCMKHNEQYHTSRYIGMALGYTFDMGRMIQDLLAARLHSIGDLVGTWHCQNCDRKYFGISQDSSVFYSTCPFCQTKAVKYVDTTLRLELGSSGVAVVGNMDGLTRTELDRNVVRFNEVKSISDRLFDTLTKAKREHEDQAKLYLYLLNRGAKIPYRNEEASSVVIDKEQATVTYLVKGHRQQPALPIKSFDVFRDEAFERQMDVHLSKVESFFKTKKGLPERTCSDQHSMMARSCSMNGRCFERVSKAKGKK
jgi:hypothetical protein